MGKIVVIGSSNTDMVAKTNRFPAPGETILGGDFFMFPGGKGANQAVAAARMGGEVSLICRIGNDVFGQSAIKGFKEEGIDTSFISISDDKASGVALILVNAMGENEIVVAPGANHDLSVDDITKARLLLANADVILMQLEIPVPTILAAAKLGYESGRKLILNPAPATKLPMELYPYLFLITPNETEAELLTGVKISNEEDASKAADKLLSLGVQNVIITLGSSGAFYKSSSHAFAVPSPLVKAVDTTAAGDVFNGALAVELGNGSDWKVAMTKACHAAAISVTRMGAQSSAPYYHEVQNLYENA